MVVDPIFSHGIEMDNVWLEREIPRLDYLLIRNTATFPSHRCGLFKSSEYGPGLTQS